MKKCITCNLVKNKSEFYFNKKLNKPSSYCKSCDNKKRLKHQQENKEQYNKRHKIWRDNNKQKTRTNGGISAVRYYRRLRLEALLSVGKNVLRCVKCGFDDIRALCIDHIDGGGSQHFKNRSSSTSYYKDMIREPSKYQLLCANCNQIKRYENKERCSSKYM